MARVRTPVSIGTVAVVVLGGLSLSLGSVMMPGSATLGGPVVLSARPELDRPLTATPDGTTDPGTTHAATDSGEAVGVRAPTPIRADTYRTATGAGSYRDTDGTGGGTSGSSSENGAGSTSGAGSTDRTTTTGTATQSRGGTLESPATGVVATSGSTPVEPAHAPKAPSRSDGLRAALATPIALETSATSAPEGTRTHDQP